MGCLTLVLDPHSLCRTQALGQASLASVIVHFASLSNPEPILQSKVILNPDGLEVPKPVSRLVCLMVSGICKQVLTRRHSMSRMTNGTLLS